MHPSDSFYAHYVHPRPERIDSHVPPRSRRSRGLVALVRLGGSSSIARGGNGRPCVLNVLANLCDDVRANCDIPAILQALGALGCASSLEYLFETLRDHSHPVTLVFERSGTGILLHDAEAGGGECSACSNPATDSPVPLALTIKLNGPMLAERTTLSMLPTITWEQGTSCRQSTVPSMPGNCSARRSRSASFVRDSTAEAELFSRGGYQRCCWRPLHAWLRSRRSELLTPLHRCVRRPTTGVDAFARMGQAGSKRALTVRERSTSPRKMARELSFQDICF